MRVEAQKPLPRETLTYGVMPKGGRPVPSAKSHVVIPDAVIPPSAAARAGSPVGKETADMDKYYREMHRQQEEARNEGLCRATGLSCVK